MSPNCSLYILDKLQKQLCRIASFTLSSSLKYLAHKKEISLSLFDNHYSGAFLCELTELVLPPYSH